MSKKDKKRIRSLERKVERFKSRLDNSDKDYISNEPKEVITCIVRVTASQKKTFNNPIVNLINQYKLKHSFL